MDLKTPDDHFLLHPYALCRGSKLVLGGPTKQGKSWILLNIIHALVFGEPLFGNSEWKAQKSRVLLVEREIGPYSIGERIKLVFGACPDWALRDSFGIISKPKGFSLSEPGCAKRLHEIIKGDGYDVCVLDPINKLHHWEENKSTDMLRLVDVLEDIIGERAGLIASHHFGKPPRGRDLENYDPLNPYNMRGSSRLMDDADEFMIISRLAGRLVKDYESWKLDAAFAGGRHGPQPPPFQIKFNEHGDCKVKWAGEKVEEDEAPQGRGRKVVDKLPEFGQF